MNSVVRREHLMKRYEQTQAMTTLECRKCRNYLDGDARYGGIGLSGVHQCHCDVFEEAQGNQFLVGHVPCKVRQFWKKTTWTSDAGDTNITYQKIAPNKTVVAGLPADHWYYDARHPNYLKPHPENYYDHRHPDYGKPRPKTCDA